MLNLKEVFNKFDNEYTKFDMVENPLNHRPDLCAFLLLDQLVRGKINIVSNAEHYGIYLSIDCINLAEVASEEDILTLIRCGVIYNWENESLRMFV